MKHLSAEIRTQAAVAGIDISSPVADRLAEHLSWLIRTNATLNLTSVTEPSSAILRHVVDSLLALPEYVAAPSGPALDIGTGGGFPGLPLAVAGARECVMLDSVQKKARALEAYLGEAGEEGLSVVGERAEDHARTSPNVYAVVTARAVSRLPSLVELAAPLLFEGGRLIALKGGIEEDELQQAEATAAVVGMRRASVRRLTLSGEGERRTIVVYEVIGPSSVPLPRRVGLAQKRPLGL